MIKFWETISMAQNLQYDIDKIAKCNIERTICIAFALG